MLGKSLRGDYVFCCERGLIKAGGLDAAQSVKVWCVCGVCVRGVCVHACALCMVLVDVAGCCLSVPC
jgi:hypothetical protein